jgi:hypothetical protein
VDGGSTGHRVQAEGEEPPSRDGCPPAPRPGAQPNGEELPKSAHQSPRLFRSGSSREIKPTRSGERELPSLLEVSPNSFLLHHCTREANRRLPLKIAFYCWS